MLMNIGQQIAEKIIMNELKKKNYYEIAQNPDFEHAAKVIKAIKDNNGYCCCKLDKTPDTKCMCKEFSEQ